MNPNRDGDIALVKFLHRNGVLGNEAAPDEGGEFPAWELEEEPLDFKNLMRGTEIPPIIKLLNLILLEGIRSRASDIHVESDLSLVRVRQRIDGMLEEAFRPPQWGHD